VKQVRWRKGRGCEVPYSISGRCEITYHSGQARDAVRQGRQCRHRIWPSGVVRCCWTKTWQA